MNQVELSIPRYEAGVPGLPGRAIPITNTERSSAGCPLRWWFRQAEGLVAKIVARPLDYGISWHAFLEDLHRWYAATDLPYPNGDGIHCTECNGGALLGGAPCGLCDGTGEGPVARAASVWATNVKLGLLSEEDAEDLALCLAAAVEGYLMRYGRESHDSWRVLDVEVPLAYPIVHPTTGRPYAPSTWLVEEDDGSLRLARTGEAAHPRARLVRWPYWQVCRLDALFEDRETGSLWVYEGKSSQSPRDYVEHLQVDPQLPAYGSAVAHLIATDPRFSGRDLGGYLYDVASSSRQRDPEVLKNGALSVAKNRIVPSWRFIRKVAELGLDPEPYRRHVLDLAARVDSRLYLREFGPIGRPALVRHRFEAFAVARLLADYRRKAAVASTANEVATSFYRQPLCRLPGGRCDFISICSADGQEIRSARFDVSPGVRWLPKGGI
jgi:hypothetical protein